MATIDDKVVAMSFESSKFEHGVHNAIRSLDKLKASLHFKDMGKGLSDIQSIMSRFHLGSMSKSIDEVSHSLGALRLAAIGVLSQIATRAISAGASFLKSFTLDPLKAGFSEYTTNLNSIQTILANTQAAGVKLKDVTAALDELNEYSDKTIYNFGQMAHNIGTFTAAGVELKTSVGAIKGISNLAALSGTSAEKASGAMYQLSQELAAGRVNLMGWNSVVQAGMGGSVFQRALAETAVAMGKIDESVVKMEGPMKNVTIHGESFRNSLSQGKAAGWLTSDVLTTTLKQFTGDLKDAELAAMGFNDAQIKAIQKTAKTAVAAATEVKDLGSVFKIAGETAGTGWADSFDIIFGNFLEAKKTFTTFSTAINDVINKNADARNKILQDWKDLGGRTVLIESIGRVFRNLGEILKPIKEAFREIFPPKTGADLMYLTQLFERFSYALKPSEETVANLKSIFKGLFAILDVGIEIIKGIFRVIFDLIGAADGAGGGFLNLAGNVGDFLVSVRNALIDGGKLNSFFKILTKVLTVPIEIIKKLASAIGNLFGGFSSGGFSTQIDQMGSSLNPLEQILKSVGEAFDKLTEGARKAGQVLREVFNAIVESFSGISGALGQVTGAMDFDTVLSIIRTGFFGALVVMFKKFLGKGSIVDQLIGKDGILGNIKGTFGALEGSMVALQQNIKAKTLKEIAIAIALLTASVVALSFVDAEDLKKSVAVMTVAFGQLLGAMFILGNITKTPGFIKMPILATTMMILAGALAVLSVSVLMLSRLSWDELARGLAGVGGALAIMVAAAVPLSAMSGSMLRASVGIAAISVSLMIMAVALKLLSTIDLLDLGKGLGAIAVGLGIMATASKALKPTSLLGVGVNLAMMAISLNLMATAVKKFASMSLTELAKGLGAVAVALGILVAATVIMSTMKNLQVASLGMIAMAGALNLIAIAVMKMASLSMDEIKKGLVGIGGAMLILAVGLAAMQGSIGGAVALGVAALGITALALALMAFGNLSWGTIIKGLVGLGVTLAVIAGASALLTPAIPALLGFGVALVLIGAGLALAGAGMFLFSTGLSALVVAGPAGFKILVAAFTAFVDGIIQNAKNLVLGVLEIVEEIAAVAPKFVDAFVKIFNSLLDVVIESLPKIIELFNALITAILSTLQTNEGKIVQAGFNLLVALLQGIKNNVPQLITLVLDIIVKILNAISQNLNRIVNAGIDLLGSLIKGILQRIDTIVTTVLTIVTRFIGAITDNLGKIATVGLQVLTRFLKAIGDNIGNVIKAGTDLIVAMVTGIGNAAERIVTAARQSAGKFINTLATQIVALADQVFTAMITLMNGLARVIENRAPEMRQAAIAVGAAIISGLTSGVTSAAGDLYSTISGVMSKAMSLVKKIPLVSSPSKVTEDVGTNIILGLVKGIDQTAPKAYESATAMSNGVINAFNTTFQTKSPSKVMAEIGQFVGQGFAQGLRGSGEDIKGAFTELNQKLTDAMVKARETIASEEDKLAKLRAAKKEDAAAIKEAQKIIAENEAILARSTAGHIALTKTLKDEKTELVGLAADYEKLGERLKEAQGKLTEAIKTRDDAIKGFAGQYGKLPEIVTEDAEGNAVDQLGHYMEALKREADAVSAYHLTLEQLRKLGLDDDTYQKLLDEGTMDAAFANQLLAGGRTAVESLNTLDKNLKTASEKLAVNAGKNLYDAGIASKRGLVKSLQEDRHEIFDEMREIARGMVAALKKELKIKSPSGVFAEIGTLSMEGLAKGFEDSSKIVTDAVDIAAQDALTAMKQSMRDISDVVTEELNPQPVITPILDLTQVRAQAGELNNLATPTASASYGQASIISSEQRALQVEGEAVALAGPTVKFEQNNYSPEALSDIEIYRQTKNQLSQLKSALALT